MNPLTLIIFFVILSAVLGVAIAEKLNKGKVLGGIIGFISSLLISVIEAVIRVQSQKMGVSPIFMFLFFGVIVALIGLIILIKPWKKGKKQCPYCSGLIPNDAKKCKHCGEWLEKSDNTNF